MIARHSFLTKNCKWRRIKTSLPPLQTGQTVLAAPPGRELGRVGNLIRRKTYHGITEGTSDWTDYTTTDPAKWNVSWNVSSLHRLKTAQWLADILFQYRADVPHCKKCARQGPVSCYRLWKCNERVCVVRLGGKHRNAQLINVHTFIEETSASEKDSTFYLEASSTDDIKVILECLITPPCY